MRNPIRYAILDHAAEDSNLWELPWPTVAGNVEIHRQRTVDEVRPWLVELIRSGHVEVYRLDDLNSPTLTERDALAVVNDDANWAPSTAEAAYGVSSTESGDRGYQIEHDSRPPAG